METLVTAPSAANVATFTVAGATLLLADFTALLAWFTWESIGATRREARIAEASRSRSATGEGRSEPGRRDQSSGTGCPRSARRELASAHPGAVSVNDSID